MGTKLESSYISSYMLFYFHFKGSSLNQEIKESDYPEPPSTEYYVGFSCLA